MTPEEKSAKDAEKAAAKSAKDAEKTNLKKVEKPAEDTVVKFSDKIWIEGTGNSTHLAKGKIMEVNRTHGEHLIAKGAAKETTAPKPKAKAPVKKETADEDDD